MADSKQAQQPDRAIVLEPYYWDTSISWTPSLIDTALTSADCGDLSSAADLCDAMMADERIRGVLSTRVNALLGSPLEWESDRAAPKKAIARDWLRIASEADLGKLIRWGIMLGVGIAHLAWTSIEGRWIPRVEVWHPRNLSYDFVKRLWVVYDDKGTRIEIQPDDPNWWIFLPYGASRPWAEGCWRALALLWLGKYFAWRDWQRHNQIHGSPAIVGTMPAGKPTSDAGAQKFWADLKAIGSKARIVLPADYTLDMLEAKASTWQTFPETKKVADVGIAIVVLGQNLTTEVDGGSYAATTAHGTVRQDYLEADAEITSTSAHDGPLSHWARYNYGNAELAPWPRYQVTPPEDVKALAETQKTGAEGTKLWIDMGVPVDRKAQAERYSIPIDPAGEFTEPKAPPAPIAPAQPPKGEQGAPEGLRQSTSDLATLASGDQLETTPGVIEGQEYVDRLAATGRDQAAATLTPWIDQVVSLIEGLEDGPDWPERLKAGLVKLYGNGPDLINHLERALILAELAGRYAVLEDL